MGGVWDMEVRVLNSGTRSYEQPETNVGASLLAISVCQSTRMLNFRASSRASSLPQGFIGVAEIWVLQVAITQRTQGAFVVGPAAFHFHPEVEHDLGVEQQLQDHAQPLGESERRL